MTAPLWAACYVGIPFCDQGHEQNGCNCIGLVHLVLKREKNIVIPTYAEISAQDMLAATREFHAAIASELWRQIDEPRAFDCVLMKAMSEGARFDGHVGIMVSDSDVLHIWRETHAVIMPLAHPRIRNKIVSFHRHRELQ